MILTRFTFTFLFWKFETLWDSLPPKREFIIGIPRMFPFHSPNMFKPLYCFSLLLVPIFFCLVYVLAMNSMLWEKNNQLFGKSYKSPQGWALMDQGYLHAHGLNTLKNSHKTPTLASHTFPQLLPCYPFLHIPLYIKGLWNKDLVEEHTCCVQL